MPSTPNPTIVLTVDPDEPAPEAIAAAAAIIRQGGLVAFPTETVYGLGANALDAAAVRRIFEAKERATDDPLIVHCLDADGVADLIAAFTPNARALGGAFWPGPLTLILPRDERVPPEVSAGLPTVAVRVPAHPVARALLAAAGVPIAAPSANRFMHTSATSAGHVLADLGGRIDMILDGGPTTAGVESTVVRLDQDGLRVLRPGAVTQEELLDALELLGLDGRIVAGPGPGSAPSPGMLAKHYAPAAPLQLFARETPFAALIDASAAILEAGGVPGLLLPSGPAAVAQDWVASLPQETRGRVRIADLGADQATAAHRLFAALRDLDARGATAIFALAFPDAGLGRAINDRLERAATRLA